MKEDYTGCEGTQRIVALRRRRRRRTIGIEWPETRRKEGGLYWM